MCLCVCVCVCVCVSARSYWTMTTGSCGASGHPNVSRMPVVDLWQNNLDTPGVQGPAHDYNNTCKGSKEGNRLGQTCTAHGTKGVSEYPLLQPVTRHQ